MDLQSLKSNVLCLCSAVAKEPGSQQARALILNPGYVVWSCAGFWTSLRPSSLVQKTGIVTPTLHSWELSGGAWQGSPNAVHFVIEATIDSPLQHERTESWNSANRCEGGCWTFKTRGLWVPVPVYMKYEWSLTPIPVCMFPEGISWTHRGWNKCYFWSQKVTTTVAGITFLVLISCWGSGNLQKLTQQNLCLPQPGKIESKSPIVQIQRACNSNRWGHWSLGVGGGKPELVLSEEMPQRSPGEDLRLPYSGTFCLHSWLLMSSSWVFPNPGPSTMDLSPFPSHSRVLFVGTLSPGVAHQLPSSPGALPFWSHGWPCTDFHLNYWLSLLVPVSLVASTPFTRTSEAEIKAKEKELKKVGDYSQGTFMFGNSFSSLKPYKASRA